MNRKTLIALFVILAFATMAVAQNTINDPSLVGRWTMRNTGGTGVDDFSGNNHYGSLIGGAFFKSDVTMTSSVEIIDGTGHLVVPHSKELEPARGTVETWIKVDSLQFADVFCKHTSKNLRTNSRGDVAGQVYGARVLEDGSVEGYIMNDDPKQKSMSTFVESPRPVIRPGSWHHIALQWDGKFVRLFVDGIVVAKKGYKEIPDVGLSYYGESEFILAPGQTFFGQIGETRIYSRPLSDVEVQQSATMPTPK